MKIGMYNPFLDENIGGGERYFLTIAEHMSKKHDVWIFLREKENACKEFLNKFASKFRLNLENVKISKNPWFKMSRLEKLLTTKKYDRFFYLTDGSLFFSCAKKNIVHFQIPFKNRPTGFVNDWKLKNWKVKVSNSIFTKEKKKKNWGIGIDFVHRCGPDIDVFRPMKKEKIILNVGRFFSQTGFKHCKRQDVLVEAFKRMVDDGLEGWRLVLIGPVDKGEDNRIYAEKVKKMVNGYPIEIKHDSSFEQLQKLYGEAYLYWHATGYGLDEKEHPEAMEHLGLSTIEAMASGAVPVVIGRGGQKEIVEDGKNGFLWNKKEKLIDLSLRLIKNRNLFDKMSQKARIRAKDFSKQKFNKMTEEIFRI